MAGLPQSIPWRRLLLEIFVLVGSVYVAIVLEGLSDARARRLEAVEALHTLRAELDQDRGDLVEILAAQRDRDVRHRRLDRWLSDGATVPADSMNADFTALFSVNRTMFPRSASWTTMVTSGQLADLRDPALVARLANFYENLNARLEYNGALYDTWVTDVARTGVPEAWDRIDGRLVTTDRGATHRLRTQLLGVHDLSLGFIGLLEEWSVELDAIIAEVDAYLGQAGGG